MLRKGHYSTYYDSEVTAAEEKRLGMHAGNENSFLFPRLHKAFLRYYPPFQRAREAMCNSESIVRPLFRITSPICRVPRRRFPHDFQMASVEIETDV